MCQKKGSQQIKKFVVEAEEAGLRWQSRGESQESSHGSFEDVLEDTEQYSQSQVSSVETPHRYNKPSGVDYLTPSTDPQHYQAYPGPEESTSTQHYQASAGLQHYLTPAGSQHYSTSTGSYGSAALFVSHRDVQNINIGSLTGPPPLVPTSHESLPLYRSPSSMFSPGLSSQSPSEQGPGMSYSQERRPSVESPFWILFIFGNISRCNGCKGRISRDQNKKLLPPPDDIVFGHKEYVIFQNQRSGMFEQSRDKRNVYYHPWKTCIAPHFSDFDPKKHIVVLESVKGKLLHMHKQFILKEFGVLL